MEYPLSTAAAHFVRVMLKVIPLIVICAARLNALHDPKFFVKQGCVTSELLLNIAIDFERSTLDSIGLNSKT